jgi:adenosine deaminase
VKSATTEEHPLMGFKNERILFSINTMEPLFLCCSLRSELDKCQKFLQFTDKDLHNCWHRAAQASFLKETEKKKLIKIIEKRAGPYIPGD